MLLPDLGGEPRHQGRRVGDLRVGQRRELLREVGSQRGVRRRVRAGRGGAERQAQQLDLEASHGVAPATGRQCLGVGEPVQGRVDMGLRVLDIFVLRLDERRGEVILSKGLGRSSWPAICMPRMRGFRIWGCIPGGPETA